MDALTTKQMLAAGLLDRGSRTIKDIRRKLSSLDLGDVPPAPSLRRLVQELERSGELSVERTKDGGRTVCRYRATKQLLGELPHELRHRLLPPTTFPSRAKSAGKRRRKPGAVSRTKPSGLSPEDVQTLKRGARRGLLSVEYLDSPSGRRKRYVQTDCLDRNT